MLAPLIVLAIGAAVTGFAFEGSFIGEGWHDFWRGSIVNAPGNMVLDDMHHVPGIISLLPTLVGVLGIALAYVMYVAQPALPARLAAAVPRVYDFVLNKWYFDELYNAIFVRPAIWLARVLWQVGDAQVIDGIPNGIAALTSDGSAQVVRIQTGSIAVYAFTMLIGLVLLVSIFLLFR